MSTSHEIGEDKYQLTDKYLWLNDNHTYHPGKKNYPFRIQYSAISDCFEVILLKWTNVNADPINRPILELFSDIITSKSIGLNRYLNLCQALEVYSKHNRDSETKAILAQEKEEGTTTDKRITLRIRMKDLFQYHIDVLPQTDDNSEDIADIRNHYTHYNPELQKKIECKYGDARTAVNKYEGLLYLLLLVTMYKEMGIPVDAIKSAMFNFNSRFGVSTEQLFEGPDKDGLQ